MGMLKYFGVLMVTLFASAYAVRHVFSAAGWDSSGWIATAAACGVGAFAFLAFNAIRGRAALHWAVYELNSLCLFVAICLGFTYTVGYAFDVAPWDAPDWLFLVGLALGTLLWSALPVSLLELFRIVPKRPPLSARPLSREYAKGTPQSFLLDRAIRRDPSER